MEMERKGEWGWGMTGGGARPPKGTRPPSVTGGGARPPNGARPPKGACLPEVAGYMPGEERGAGELTGHFFAERAEVERHRRHLPHWGQDGVLCFVTFRLADSLPAAKLAEWKVEKEDWLKRHPDPWGEEERKEYLARFPYRLEKWLDAGHGECLLRGDAARRCMDGVFARSDGGKCRLHAYVVMPNHVHVLFELRARDDLPGLLQEWKGVSAHLLNRELGRKGRVWQEEYHDRLVRDAAHYRRVVGYIGKNWELREGLDGWMGWGTGAPPVTKGRTGAPPVADGVRKGTWNVEGEGRMGAMTGGGARPLEMTGGAPVPRQGRRGNQRFEQGVRR